MPDYIAVYNLKKEAKSPATEFVKQALKLGWSTSISSSKNIIYRLPDGSLRGAFRNQEEATKAFKKIAENTRVSGLSAKVTKYFVCEFTSKEYESDVVEAKKPAPAPPAAAASARARA